ncbi:MAG: short-subunit dehydrogenase [Cellvibrionaceae bacterium]|jgi:short-subunit dehydrogenase
MQLENKVVLLTGAQGGIGGQLLVELKNAGAEVIAVGRRQQPGMTQCDLGNKNEVDTLCNDLRRRDIDVIINLAGLMYFGHAHQQTSDHLHTMMTVNLTTPIQLVQAVLPGMIKRSRGQVVNIGSIFDSLSFPHFSVYSASKAGLKGFSDGLRREYQGKGIKVTHISPRAVDTPFNSYIITELHQRSKTHTDSSEKVAKIIVKAIIEDKHTVKIGFPERLFTKINTFMPTLIDKALVAKRDLADELLEEYKS